MKIDELDKTLVCGENDFQVVLTYFKDNRRVPDYIEKAIMKIVLQDLYLRDACFEKIEEYFQFLPEIFVNDVISNLNTMFFNFPKVEYKHKQLSYLLYYLPANIFKVWKPLQDLHLRNILKPDMRILDVGTGPGSVSIGVIEYYKSLAESFPELTYKLSFVLLDSDLKFLSLAQRLFEAVSVFMPINLSVTIEEIICENIGTDSSFKSLGDFDLILISNFINCNEGENSRNATPIIYEFSNNIKSDGSLIIIEPADEKSCVSFKSIRNEIVNSGILNIFSPCIGLWESKSKYECTCFGMVRCFWDIPMIYDFLISKGLKKGNRVDVPFNYVVFRKDNAKKYSIIKNTQYFTKLVDLKEKVGQNVNVIAIISTVIKKGYMVSFKICDGSCQSSLNPPIVWVDMTNDQLIDNGISIPLIAAEKITLKKFAVQANNMGFVLMMNKSSSITIDY